MPPQHGANCFNCKNYLRFTPAEKALIEEMLQRNQYARPVWGACTAYDGGAAWLVRRYITIPMPGCTFWRAGQYREPLDCRCPQCKSGALAIVRPSRDKQTHTLIGCMRHPECSFNTRLLPLERRCRYCDVQLVLETGDLMTCLCPKCKRAVPVPLMLRIWPQLTATNGACTHGVAIRECSLCQASLRAKVNLLVMEMPAVVTRWLTVEREHRPLLSLLEDDVDNPDASLDLVSSLDIDWSPESEELEEMWGELDETVANFARSSDEGWYYPD